MPNVNQNVNIREDVDRNRNTNVNTNTGSSSGVHGNTSTQVNIRDRGGSSSGQVVTGSSHGGGFASPSSSSSDYAAQAAAARAAAERAAAEEAARRAELERQRNEQLARANDAKRAQETREAQANREERTTLTPATQAANPVAAATQAKQTTTQQNTRQRVRPVSAEEVASGGDVSEDYRSNGFPLINQSGTVYDSDTGEVISEVPETIRANMQPTYEANEARAATQPVPRSRLAQAVANAAPQTAYSSRAEGRVNTIPADKVIDNSDTVIDDNGPYVTEEYFPPEDQQEPSNDRTAYRNARSSLGLDQLEADVSSRDTVVSGYTDITGIEGRDEQINEILRQETERHSKEYGRMRERGVSESTDYSEDPEQFFEDDQNESHFQRLMMKARNAILQRFLNPYLLRVEGMWVETTEDNGKTYGRVHYSKRAQNAIDAVKSMYGGDLCSTYNVLQLVQLRGGIGVSLRGKIANVNPNEFRLTEDQFVELCHDICESQNQNGNPLGPVQGTPGGNGVRDDTGRFVVVAKTRCFPLGYMPVQLIEDLRNAPGSKLSQYSVDQVKKMVGEQWINETYPQLCANTGGNLMYQARAIENMMRGLMHIDGANPKNLKIPEVVERQTLMALRAEASATTDGDIAIANEMKRDNLERTLSRWSHRWLKQSGSRSNDGSIQSAAGRRRRTNIGDGIRSLEMLKRASRAANIGVMISSVPEAIVAEGEQGLANLLSNAVFNGIHKDIADQYRVTDRLDELSRSKEAIEATDVAESLYRIGGHDAIDAFLGELGDDGRAVNHMTKADLYAFLQRWGVTGQNASVSDSVREALGIKPGQEAGFLSNVKRIVDGMDNLMLSSGMFKERQSRQLVQMGMAEMARASLHGRESYTAQQVQDWGEIGGGEELIRSLLSTDAGREAFMTQGITSLGRKSPVEHQLRLIMGKNGVTEFAVRNMFDRFPEYGVNKILQMVPFSNTLSYLTAYGIKNVGDILATANTDSRGGRAIVGAGEAMQRNWGYQAGSRTSFAEGLRKNIMYDTVMATEKLMIAGLYCGWIMAMGGVQPPDDDRDRYTWSEWKIGDGPDAVPLKWAWWMDDLSGVGLPLGMAWAICETNGWTPESKQTATNTFINAIANFNSGTALFDAIDLVNNFDEEWQAVLGKDIGDYDPGWDEWAMTMLEQGFWDLVGDMTPAFVGQLVPWSKDYIFAGDRDAHTASRVYDTGEGSKYSMEEAQEGYHTKRAGSYSDYMRRRSSQTNILQAMFYDWFYGAGDSDSAITGYKYTEMPLDTMVDPYVQAMYDRFYLDLDDPNALPIKQDERKAELNARASEVVQWIDDHYENAMQANLDGFVLNYGARVNCINYCYDMINQAWDVYNEKTSHGWLSNADYRAVVEERQEKIEHYQNLIYNYFQSDDIPWSMPRYVRQETDTETRYLDANGNASTYLNTLGDTSYARNLSRGIVDALGQLPVLNRFLTSGGIGDENAREQSYFYGNNRSLMPASSPRTAGKGHNFETIPYWAVLDKDGNPVNDIASMYDNAGNMVAGQGRNEGKNIRELMWGGQGTNMGPDADEELRIGREGVPTLGGGGGVSGGRPWRIMEETFPESLKNLDADTVSKLLGIPSSLPTDDDKSKSSDDDSSGGNSYSRSYGRSYSRSYYGGGGGGWSNYNPRIYSSPRQVYSQRASGLSTRSPYKATSTYLRPSFYTSGSRKSYRRQN